MDIEVFYSPSLLTYFLMFLSVYLFAYFVIFRSWDPKRRTEASSCFMSLAHGTPAVIMSIHALLNTPNPRTFAAANTALHDGVLEYSIAYFLMDLLHYMLFCPGDILFILHHLATLYVLATGRYLVQHGAFGILVLLVLAEVTSCYQNIWSIASLRKADVPAAAKVYGFLCIPFYALYSLVRGVLGPLFVLKLVVFYLSGETNGLIPAWAWVSWMVVIVTAILLSILWVSNHWMVWFRERSYKAQKKGG